MKGVIVAGMHRSGTSLTARQLSRLGFHPGDLLLEDHSRRHEEYFEDAQFVALNRSFIETTTGHGRGHRDWGVLADSRSTVGDPTPIVSAAREFTTHRSGHHDAWLAKDPRATLFLDQWAEASPEVGFILLVRAPWDVVSSAMHLGIPDFCDDPDLVRRTWSIHTEAVVSFACANRERVLVLAAEAWFSDRGAQRAACTKFLGRDFPTDADDDFDGSRFRNRLIGDPIGRMYSIMFPDVFRLYLDALETCAVQPPRGGTGNPLSHIVRGGTLPEGTGVQVVVCTRNDAVHLDESIASVAASTAETTELTIVDDGTDHPGHLEMLRRLTDSGFQVLRTAGLGLPAARNVGAAASATLGVIPLDADNRLASQLLEALVLLWDDSADVVHGNWRQFGMEAMDVVVPTATLDHLLPVNSIDACALIRRATLEAVGGWDESLPFWEDWDIWLRMIRAGARFAKVDGTTFEYLVRPSSLSAHAMGNREIWRSVHSRIVEPHLEHADRQKLDFAADVIELSHQLKSMRREIRDLRTKIGHDATELRRLTMANEELGQFVRKATESD